MIPSKEMRLKYLKQFGCLRWYNKHVYSCNYEHNRKLTLQRYIYSN